MIDFAGSSIVHVVGGLSGLWGALIVGPRTGRFVNGVATPFPGHKVALIVLGCLLLWTGWFGFNAGAMLRVSTPVPHELFGGTVAVLSTGESVLFSPTLAVKHTLVSTTLGATGAALSGLVLSKVMIKVFDVCFIVNCLLGGLVSITAGAATMEPYAALLVGAFGVLVYTGTSRATTYFQVDDPVDGTGVHLGCGLWGTLSVGFFSTERLQAIAGFNHTHYGLAYGGGGRLLLCQVIGIAVIGAMVTVTIAPLFLLLRAFGILRVTADQEEAGIDEICHGGAAYPEDVRPWDTIVRENSLESPTSPSTVVLPGQGSLDPDAIDSLMVAGDDRDDEDDGEWAAWPATLRTAVCDTDAVVVNYCMRAAGQGDDLGGHVAPVGGWEPASDRLLLLDVWPETGPCWVTTPALAAAAATVDVRSGRVRRMVELRLGG
ncbi:hypothetical protein I4F81_012903 [Pyropia yezoensis]|uniref:Uncharacterized protein n=1 Tax=Pyropia yezoensis TaxID=2788 RepID=A0ACC3CKB5_PYRYE|nr:hypothetical protein I4F81_012903 [Neopyropia yezoensis]